MAQTRSRPPFPGIWGLMGLSFLLCTLAAASSSPSASTPSQAANVDLICHTDNSSECYPKVFVPTDEFKTVHDDQDLPPGLHVRLNVYTGTKEAKINVPDEQIADLVDSPVDTSIVVVDQPEEDIQLPFGAPIYEAVGIIKEPPKSAESQSFFESLGILKEGQTLEDTLLKLEELSHDIYYGLKIAEDHATLQNLLCHASTASQFRTPGVPTTLTRARLAANTLAGALQNNPKALAEVEKHWPTLKALKCATDDDRTLLHSTFNLAGPLPSTDPKSPPSYALYPDVLKARISALKSLLRSPAIRADFLANKGMTHLLTALTRLSGEEWEPAKEKIALLVQDVFLDGDLGATLGEWPVDDQADETTCREMGRVGDQSPEQCWDYEARRMAAEHRGTEGHWSQELWRGLREARGGVKKGQRWRDHDEL